MLDDVAAVFELDEGRLRLLLGAKENLCDFIVVADAAFGWTPVSAQTNARVAAGKLLAAGLGAGRTITWLMAKLGAALMGALPSARLITGCAGLAAPQHAFAVCAAVLTWLLAWRAVAIARLPALVRADQETVTLVRTAHMKPTLVTPATCALTCMPTF